MTDLMNRHLTGREFKFCPSILFSLFFLLFLNLIQAYFKEADSTVRVGASEMLVVVKVYVTEEPGVSKLLPRSVKPLTAAQMPPCAENKDLTSKLVSFFREVFNTSGGDAEYLFLIKIYDAQNCGICNITTDNNSQLLPLIILAQIHKTEI